MGSINIRPHELAGALAEEAKRIRAAIPLASMAAARHFAAYLAEQIDERGITDRGILKNSIHVERALDGGATCTITAPHAGIVELGARPHAVSAAGRAAIAEWAIRKLGLDEKAAFAVAWAVAAKIRREGQKPTYVVRDSMPMASRYFGEELTRILNRGKRS